MEDLVTFDATDLRLLAKLQSTRRSRTKTWPPPSTSRRPPAAPRQALVEAGVIERRVAILSPQRLGAGLTVFAEVSLDRQGASTLPRSRYARSRSLGAAMPPRLPGPDLMLVIQCSTWRPYHGLVQRLFTQTRTCAT